MRKLLEKLSDLEQQLHDFFSKNYYNSQSVIKIEYFNSQDKKHIINLNLTHLLLIGALTQSSVLLSGSSGSGKTLLAEMMAKFLFGKKQYTRKNITPDMNEQDFMDIDFGAIKEGKKLKEAMSADKLFDVPCLIIDEANRAPPIIQNRLIQILENNIDLKSKIVHAGILLNQDKYYHWNLLTLNIGTEYAGTSMVDRALKDRIVLDIDIDNFPPTLDDQISMIRNPFHSENDIEYISYQDLIIEIYKALDEIQLSLEAEALILYLSFTSNCIKSSTGSKYGVSFSPQFCKENDCPYSRNPPLNEICPFTFAPSNRVLRRLVQTSKGFSLLKHAKIINDLKKLEDKTELQNYLNQINFDVTLFDVISIAPLVLNSKISMNREWVMNKFNGNLFLACKHFLKVIYEQLEYFMKNLLKPLVEEKDGKELSEKEKGTRENAIKSDFHFKGLMKYVKEYLI
ncbi:MAG: AAA family ATPase [Candidatus Thorarchaeota archaeon]